MRKRLILETLAIAVIEASVASAQTVSTLTAFEVASVHPHQGPVFRTGPLIVSSTLVRLEGYTVFGLVMDAYGLRDYQLALKTNARPDDIYNTMYDVVARAPGERVPSLDETRAMLRTLLAERFHLRIHRETKEMAVYELVAGKNGPKLKESSADGQCSVHSGLASDGRNNEEIFSSCPVERLADRLTNLIQDRPVLDRTGLTGRYDFRLVVIPEYRSRLRSDPSDIPTTAALGELGLRLLSRKASSEMLIVDHFDSPSEN